MCFLVRFGKGSEYGRVGLELSPIEGLPKRPVGWSCIVGDYSVAIAGSDLEGEGLTIQVIVALPVLSPVSGHCLPTGFRAFDGYRDHITSSTYICYENKIEV